MVGRHDQNAAFGGSNTVDDVEQCREGDFAGGLRCRDCGAVCDVLGEDRDGEGLLLTSVGEACGVDVF